MEKISINIELQYFRGCPNYLKAIEELRSFINNSPHLVIQYQEILIENIESARKYKFRGSPTILINGKDLEGVPENNIPALSCRYYPNGVPTEAKIRKFVKELLES